MLYRNNFAVAAALDLRHAKCHNIAMRRVGLDLFTPAKVRTVADQAKEQILELIRSGRLHPGDKLPSERELSARLGISRTCVREAVQALAMTRVLDIQPGRGAFVMTGNPDELIARAIEESAPRRGKLLELYELRKAIEVESAALAADRATDHDLDAMRRRLADMEERLRQGKSAVGADVKFHLDIAAAAHNPLIYRVMESLTSLLQRSFHETQRLEDHDYILEGHREIFAEIEKHNVEGAREIMRRHLERSHSLLKQLSDRNTSVEGRKNE
mgnify:CR=1 FL=1